MITNTGISKSALGPAIETLAYTKEETNELLAGKADKATTLAGYGITDAVTLGTAQEITAVKTHTAQVKISKNDDNLALSNPNVTAGQLPASRSSSSVVFCDKNYSQLGYITNQTYTDGTGRARVATYNYSKSASAILDVFCQTDGVGYVTAPSRGYNAGASYQDDVATIKTLDQYGPMVRTTGNQTIGGEKTFDSPGVMSPGGWHSTYASTGNINEIKLFAKLKNANVGRFADIEITQSSNTAICYGVLSIHITTGYPMLWSIRKTLGSNNSMTADSILVAINDDTGDVYLASRKKAVYGNLMYRVIKEVFYGAVASVSNSSIEWLPTAVNIGDGTGYTLIEAVE